VDAVQRHYYLARSEAVRVTHQLLAETRFSIESQGAAAAYALHPPALLVSGARHYSITKAADVLGIGRENVVLVDVDERFRMEVRDLEAKLAMVERSGRLPLAVIAIAGTTEEGAVDPIHRVARLRDAGANFWLHIDAAWGGYLRTVFQTGCDFPDFDLDDVRRFVSRDGLTWGDAEVCAAFAAFPSADSITVDPHKLGYVPYPCGVAAYRNDFVRQFVSQEIPYLSDSHYEDIDARLHRPPESVGPYILEGSKPGSAVASCWLSHRMIPPDRSGYGQILRASLLAAADFYARLMQAKTEGYRLIPITLSAPDTNVVCFFAKSDANPDLACTNALNRRLFDAFTHQSSGEMPPFFLSRTVFEPSSYSSSAICALLERAAIDPGEYRMRGLFVLRATLMSPYLNMAAEAHKWSHLEEFFARLDAETQRALGALGQRTQGEIAKSLEDSASVLDR